jgi:hypothetical protein
MSESVHAHREAFNLLCDQLIGTGIGRQVFSSAVFTGSVIKVESSAGSFQNIIEWETWQRVKETKFAKWFAPCEHISPCGSLLIMAKTAPALEYPEQMPAFLTDFKRANYGMLNGNLVCHDYGTNLLFENGMTKRLKKVEWWDL